MRKIELRLPCRSWWELGDPGDAEDPLWAGGRILTRGSTPPRDVSLYLRFSKAALGATYRLCPALGHGEGQVGAATQPCTPQRTASSWEGAPFSHWHRGTE